MRLCECTEDEMLGDFFCSDIKRNMEELCRDDQDDDDEMVQEITTLPAATNDDDGNSVTTESDDLNEIDVDRKPRKSNAPTNLLKKTELCFVALLLLTPIV